MVDDLPLGVDCGLKPPSELNEARNLASEGGVNFRKLCLTRRHWSHKCALRGSN